LEKIGRKVPEVNHSLLVVIFPAEKLSIAVLSGKEIFQPPVVSLSNYWNPDY
jgi:hypothetical protein